MKRFSLLLLCFILVISSYGQEKKEVYVVVNVISTVYKTIATVDFGDGTIYATFANEKGKERDFTTAFEPVQELIQIGWRAEQFTTRFAGGQTIITWLMKKEVSDDSEIKNGMKLIVK